MTPQMFALSLGLGAMLAAADLAQGAPRCDSRETLVALLADRCNETRRAFGIAGQSAVMELFAAEAAGTWSITLTLPDGPMCLMATDTNYEAVTEDLPAKGNPA